jgi:type I restriction enzyme S subunit
MSANKNSSNQVKLGDYIQLCDERNSDGEYKLNQVRGISILKKLIETKADMQDVPLFSYKILKPREFAYVTVTSRNGEKISLAINDSDETYMVSSSYLVFKSINKDQLLPEYLYLMLSRIEFDRLSRFNSWGSARETFDWIEFCRIQIPLPDLNIQQKLVDAYNGLKVLAEENEALVKPLTEACQSYIVDCKKKYSEVALSEYIEEVNERNTSNEITLTQGIDVNMQFITAKREAADKEGTKIVRTGQFAFNKVVKANGTKLPIALRTGPDCIISSSYTVFEISNEELDAKFLRLWFSRSEVHRYCGFISQGTTRDVFSYDDLCNLKIPLPPPEVQQAIVDIYNCAEVSKKIANDAREKMKNLCPALVQRALNG